MRKKQSIEKGSYAMCCAGGVCKKAIDGDVKQMQECKMREIHIMITMVISVAFSFPPPQYKILYGNVSTTSSPSGGGGVRYHLGWAGLL